MLFGSIFDTLFGIRYDLLMGRIKSDYLLLPPSHLPIPLGDRDILFHFRQSPETCYLRFYELSFRVDMMHDEVGNLFYIYLAFRFAVEF